MKSAGFALVDLIPGERCRNSRIRSRSHGVRGSDGAILRVLVVVDEHAVALFLPPLAGGEIRHALLDFAREREGCTTHFVEDPAAFESHADVHAARAGRLRPAGQIEVLQDGTGHRGDFLYLLPFDSGHRVEIDAQFVGMLEVFGAHRMRVQLEASKIGEPGERRRVTRYDFLGRAPRRKAQFDHLDPGRPALGRPLLIEVLAPMPSG